MLTVERRAKDPVIRLTFFSNRQISIAGTIALATGAVQASFVFIPTFVVQAFAVDPSTASFMLTPFVLATAVGSPVFGRMIDRYGDKKIIIAGLILLVAGFYLLSVTGTVKGIYSSQRSAGWTGTFCSGRQLAALYSSQTIHQQRTGRHLRGCSLYSQA